MRKTRLLLLLVLAACGDAGKDKSRAAASTARTAVTLDSTALITAQLRDPVISTAHKVGDTLTAVVVRADGPGANAVPFLPGAFLHVTIRKLDASGVEFSADSLLVRSRGHRLKGSVAPLTPTTTVTGAVLLDRATSLTVTLLAPLTLVPPAD